MSIQQPESNSRFSRATGALAGILALALTLAACGDGGNSGERPGFVTPTGNQGVNGSLRGDIWHTSEGFRLDVRTGAISQLSNYNIYPRGDGREYAELIPEYQTYSGGSCSGLLSASSTGINIRDSVSLDSLNFMEIRMRLFGPVLISPDGQTIAAFAKPFNECADDDSTFVQLIDRNGEFVRYLYDVLSFQWMPDNRLAYLFRRDGAYKLAVASEPASFAGFVTATIPTDLVGTPTRFRISPDGTQVLFELVTGNPVALTSFRFREATVWMMNLDGSNLRQLADTSREPTITNDAPRINQPVWSPDGQHVLMTENFKDGFSFVSGWDATLPTLAHTDLITVDYPYATYIVPANSGLTLLPPASYSPTGVRPLLWRDGRNPSQVLAMDPMTMHVWTPEIQ